MLSDSETTPSPLPSPVFARCSPARGTVARRCREFYLRRLERTTKMQKRWSLVDSSPTSEVITQEAVALKDTIESKKSSDGESSSCTGNNVTDAIVLEQQEFHYPLRKCRSSLDIAMGSLRKEISSLISQDNDLFRQLLSLHDSIAELRERQRSCYALCPDDDEDDDAEVNLNGDHDDSPSPSLESLSDMGDQETSPDSTLSSRSSLSATGSSSTPGHQHHHHHHSRHNHRVYNNHRHRNPRHQNHHQQQRSSSETHKKHYHTSDTAYDDSRPLIFIDRSEICFRCRKVAPPYRRSSSINSLYWLQEDMDSYDSGIHLQGCHSDSDHEIFV